MSENPNQVRSTVRSGADRSGALSAAEIIRRLEITEEDLAAVRRFGTTVMHRMEDYNRLFYAWMAEQPEWTIFFGDPDRLRHVQKRQIDHWRDLFEVERIDDAFVERRVRVGEIHARIGLSMPAYFAGIDRSLQIFFRDLQEGRLTDQEMNTLGLSVTKLLHADVTLVLDAYNRATSQKISEQANALMEMSTPVTALWDNILMLPVVGIIDSNRAQDIMKAVLRSISDSRAKVFIMDISGVPVVDTAVANHIIKITRATRLMGCQSVLSGVSPTIAQTVVELGIDIGGIVTKATLRDALESAYGVVGIRLVTEASATADRS